MADIYALVDNTDLVVNLILWDGIDPYTPPSGLTLVLVDVDPRPRIGDSYDRDTHVVTPAPGYTPSVEEVNVEAIYTAARTALVNNVTFLANLSPSNLEVIQQVRALTRQANGLIRLTIGQLDSTEGT